MNYNSRVPEKCSLNTLEFGVSIVNQSENTIYDYVSEFDFTDIYSIGLQLFLSVYILYVREGICFITQPKLFCTKEDSVIVYKLPRYLDSTLTVTHKCKYKISFSNSSMGFRRDSVSPFSQIIVTPYFDDIIFSSSTDLRVTRALDLLSMFLKLFNSSVDSSMSRRYISSSILDVILQFLALGTDRVTDSDGESYPKDIVVESYIKQRTTQSDDLDNHIRSLSQTRDGKVIADYLTNYLI